MLNKKCDLCNKIILGSVYSFSNHYRACKKLLPTERNMTGSYSHNWYMRNRKKRLSQSSYANHKERIKKYMSEYNKKPENRRKQTVRQIISQAVKYGRIIKPLNCSVPICNNENPQAHHYAGYEQENVYKIVWLCARHHYYEHHKDAVMEALI